MKRKTLLAVVLPMAVVLGALLGMNSQGAVVPTSPPWVDANMVQGSVYPVTMVQNQTLVGGAVETNTDHTTVFTLVEPAPPGFVVDILERNTFKFVYTPATSGIVYVMIDVHVTEPYEGPTVRWTLAINSREVLYPSLEWFHSSVQN